MLKISLIMGTAVVKIVVMVMIASNDDLGNDFVSSHRARERGVSNGRTQQGTHMAVRNSLVTADGNGDGRSDPNVVVDANGKTMVELV